MERPNAWKGYSDKELEDLNYLCEGYKAFISDNKTERECCEAAIDLAEGAGYESLGSRIASGRKLVAGDKVYAAVRDKSLMLVQIGTEPLENGVNILGAHIDSPRLDVKQNPLEEKNEIVTLDTRYYGGGIALRNNFNYGIYADLSLRAGYAETDQSIDDRTGAGYDIRNIRGHGKTVCTNHAWGSAFRGYGSPQAFLSSEIAMDILAEKLGKA